MSSHQLLLLLYIATSSSYLKVLVHIHAIKQRNMITCFKQYKTASLGS